MTDRLPSRSAHCCGDFLVLVGRERPYSVGGTLVMVREELYRCSVCGEEEYSFEQMETLERTISDLARRVSPRVPKIDGTDDD